MRVIWMTDIPDDVAPTQDAAALAAWRDMRRSDTIATVFNVVPASALPVLDALIDTMSNEVDLLKVFDGRENELYNPEVKHV